MPALKFASKALLASALSLVSVLAVKADPVVTNGSFTATTGTGQLGYNTTVTGWTSAAYNSTYGYNFLFSPSTATTSGSNGQYGAVALFPGSASTLASPDGGNFIGLDGGFQQSALSTTVTGLTVGQLTNVSFYFAGAQQNNRTGATSDSMNVTFGNQTLSTPTIQDASQSFTGWNLVTLQFTPTSTSQTLSFLAVGAPSGEPPFSLLDGVSVTNAPAIAATPEPNSLLLLGTGLTGTAAMLRRRFFKR